MTPTISEPSTRPARIRGKLLFTFAAIADTHVNEDERISTSPFPSTALTTARARYAFAAVNASRPAFVVNYGVHHGFAAQDAEPAKELAEACGLASAIDGLVFRIVREGSGWDEIAAARALAASLGMNATVTVRLAATESPAEAQRDDREHANRVAEAALAAAAYPEMDIFIDTVADIDRGYFVRNGLVDRRYNPRLAAAGVMHLNEALARIEGDLTLRPKSAVAGCRLATFRTPDAHHAVILPDRASMLAEIALPASGANAAGKGAVAQLDSGVVARIPWRRRGAGSEAGIRFARPLQCDAPALFSIPAGGTALQAPSVLRIV